MTLRKCWDAIKKRVRNARTFIAPPMNMIDPDTWSQAMREHYQSALSLGQVMVASEVEANDPLTKAMIVQQLSDMTVKHPNASMRAIISEAFQDGVRDDYDLLDKLNACDKQGFTKKSGDKITISSRSHQRMSAAAEDAISKIQRQLLDNMNLIASARLVQLDGCSDPEDKTGSCGGK